MSRDGAGAFDNLPPIPIFSAPPENVGVRAPSPVLTGSTYRDNKHQMEYRT
jgi:hypothetical protein